MPTDSTLVGRSYSTAGPYEVCREKIREFAAAVGEAAPACRDVAAARDLGHPDLVAPPTFPTLLAFGLLQRLLADPDLGLALHRVVHADQRFRYTRPVCAGDRLLATLTVDDVRRVAGADLIRTRTEITTAAGEAVCTALAGLVHRGGEDGA